MSRFEMHSRENKSWWITQSGIACRWLDTSTKVGEEVVVERLDE